MWGDLAKMIDVESVDSIAIPFLGAAHQQCVIDDRAAQPALRQFTNGGAVIGSAQRDGLEPSENRLDDSSRFFGMDSRRKGQSCQGRISFSKTMGSNKSLGA